MAGDTGARKSSTLADVMWHNRSTGGKIAAVLLGPAALATGAAVGAAGMAVAAAPYLLYQGGKKTYELGGLLNTHRQNWWHDAAKTQQMLSDLDFLPKMLSDEQQEKALKAIGRMPTSGPHETRTFYQKTHGEHLSNGFSIPGSGKPAKDEKSEAEPDKTFSDILAEYNANPETEDEDLKTKGEAINAINVALDPNKRSDNYDYQLAMGKDSAAIEAYNKGDLSPRQKTQKARFDRQVALKKAHDNIFTATHFRTTPGDDDKPLSSVQAAQQGLSTIGRIHLYRLQLEKTLKQDAEEVAQEQREQINETFDKAIEDAGRVTGTDNGPGEYNEFTQNLIKAGAITEEDVKDPKKVVAALEKAKTTALEGVDTARDEAIDAAMQRAESEEVALHNAVSESMFLENMKGRIADKYLKKGLENPDVLDDMIKHGVISQAQGEGASLDTDDLPATVPHLKAAARANGGSFNSSLPFKISAEDPTVYTLSRPASRINERDLNEGLKIQAKMLKAEGFKSVKWNTAGKKPPMNEKEVNKHQEMVRKQFAADKAAGMKGSSFDSFEFDEKTKQPVPVRYMDKSDFTDAKWEALKKETPNLKDIREGAFKDYPNKYENAKKGDVSQKAGVSKADFKDDFDQAEKVHKGLSGDTPGDDPTPVPPVNANP